MNQTHDSLAVSDWRRLFEISAVLLTGIGKFLFMDFLDLRLPFIAVAISFWLVYILIRKRTEHSILHYWGFRTDNFKRVTFMVLPWGVAAVLAFIAIGLTQGTLNLTWHIIPILILYPLWGVIQQFLIIALIAGNLQDMNTLNLSRIVIICLTAVLFAIIHAPYWWLVVGTFILALFYGFIYLRAKNLYVLGLFHGWLGA